MARKRQIDPAIWTSEQFCRLSDGAKLMFIGLFSNADDEGRIKARTDYLKAIIFPEDRKTLRAIRGFRDEVMQQQLGFLYSHDGTEYIFLPGFAEHQYISKRQRSHLPAPPPELVREHSRTVPEPFPNRSFPIGNGNDIGNGIPPTPCDPLVVKVWEDYGKASGGGPFNQRERELVEELMEDYTPSAISEAIKIAAGTDNRRVSVNYLRGILKKRQKPVESSPLKVLRDDGE